MNQPRRVPRTERANRGTGAGSVRSLDASALQSDIARRLNLPGAAVKRVKYLAQKSSTASHRTGSETHVTAMHRCPSCAQPADRSDLTCPNCGIFFRSIREFEPTLAEARGLVARSSDPVVPMSQSEWSLIEHKLWERQDGSCPICMEGFTTGHEVLLSCSHMFHRYNLEGILLISTKTDIQIYSIYQELSSLVREISGLRALLPCVQVS